MLSSTKLQLAKPNAVSCKLFDFYPGNVSVEWLRDGVVVKRPESPPAQLGPDGLFTAESFLSLTPSTADAGANFSCRIRHRALDSPITRHFQLQVQGGQDPFLMNPLVGWVPLFQCQLLSLHAVAHSHLLYPITGKAILYFIFIMY